MMRSRRGRWVLIALACVAVLLVGLLAQGFLGGPGPSVAAPDEPLKSYSPAPTTAKPSKPARSTAATGTRLVGNPTDALRQAFLDNPLNHLRGAGLHNVVVTASARGGIAVLGYLVPTGLGSTSGVVKTHPSSWAVRERAIGKGYLAAVFVQTGKSGTPVTCTVRIDGKVTDRQTTSGAYGRTLCLG